MDSARQNIIRKTYLSAIAEHADRIYVLARKLETARDYRDANAERGKLGEYNELAQAVNRGDLTLEDANLTDHTLSLNTLRDMEKMLETAMYDLNGCYEVSVWWCGSVASRT